jgi:hypothetical protein
MRLRFGTLVAAVIVTGILVGIFVTRFLNPTPSPIVATATSTTLQGRPVVNVTLTTVGTIGSGPHPNWVSYLPTTYIHVPVGAVVHMTINQQDSATGLRNPYFSLVRGTINDQMTVNGKAMQAMDPSTPAHTFTIPDLGVSVPLPGVSASAPAGSQNVVQFDFVVPDQKGLFRWQCFVPCGAGTLYGNGGPMQTLGYMAGELQVG